MVMGGNGFGFSVVGHRDPDFLPAELHTDGNSGDRMCVLKRIGESLLDDPIDGQLDPRVRGRFPLQMQDYWKAR